MGRKNPQTPEASTLLSLGVGPGSHPFASPHPNSPKSHHKAPGRRSSADLVHSSTWGPPGDQLEQNRSQQEEWDSIMPNKRDSGTGSGFEPGRLGPAVKKWGNPASLVTQLELSKTSELGKGSKMPVIASQSELQGSPALLHVCEQLVVFSPTFLSLSLNLGGESQLKERLSVLLSLCQCNAEPGEAHSILCESSN